MIQKPFKTFDNQIEYLNQDKAIACDLTLHKIELIKKGYYNIINAYKNPFVDWIESLPNSQIKHHYHPGTTIEHFLALRDFDEHLRQILFSTLVNLEEEIKNISSYLIAKHNPDDLGWEDINYYENTLSKRMIYDTITKTKTSISKSKNSYLNHYLDRYNDFPIWVVVKNLQLNDFISLLTIVKTSSNSELCYVYGVTHLDGNVVKADYKRMISMLHLIREFRNVCAHNERTYDLTREKVNGSKRIHNGFDEFVSSPKRYTSQIPGEQKLVDLLVNLKYFLEAPQYSQFIHTIINLFNNLSTKIPNSAFDKVRSSTGIRTLSDLNYLADNNHHQIDYMRL